MTDRAWRGALSSGSDTRASSIVQNEQLASHLRGSFLERAWGGALNSANFLRPANHFDEANRLTLPKDYVISFQIMKWTGPGDNGPTLYFSPAEKASVTRRIIVMTLLLKLSIRSLCRHIAECPQVLNRAGVFVFIEFPS
jgi:hypothetical protein